MSNFFCPRPWTSTFVDSNGQQSICCRCSVSIPTKTLDFNHEQVRKVRLQMLNNEVPESCSYCTNVEKSGATSLRKYTLEYEELKFEQAKAATDETGKTTLIPTNHDIVLGNKCNLRCMTCTPTSSSAWVEDWDFITQGKKNDYFSIVPVKGKLKLLPDIYDWPSDQGYIDSIWESIKESGKRGKSNVWFSGGEATLQPAFNLTCKKSLSFR